MKVQLLELNHWLQKMLNLIQIVGGNPGRLVKYRFDNKTIKRLLEIRWWDKELEEIAEIIPLLQSNDTNKIIKKYSHNLFDHSKKSLSSIYAHFSKIHYLYIFLKSKNNLKEVITNINEYRAIKRQGLFDECYYLNNYKNILNSEIDPLIHYICYGYNENKNPSLNFDTNYYLDRYDDVRSSKMNPLIHYSLYGIDEERKTNIKISVVVTSYNHEKYIKECIDSILMQEGVDFELIIGDDHSQDNTRNILKEYQKQYPEAIKLLPLAENLGVTKNLKRCLKEATGDYIAICEGDDYWTDPHKLQKQATFLEKRKNCSMCFNSVLVYYNDKNQPDYILHKRLNKTIFTTNELVLDNFIGNFSCCMYRNINVKKLPDTLYDFFTVDWMFNIACSQHGKIGFLDEQMSVYQIHNLGIWSGKDRDDQISDLLRLIDIYITLIYLLNMILNSKNLKKEFPDNFKFIYIMKVI